MDKPTEKQINIIKELADILQHPELEDLFDKTIIEIKEFIVRYQERNPQIKEIVQGKNYKGHEGFYSLVDDMQSIVKNKVFNYFFVSKKEFNDATNREEKPLCLFKIVNKDLSFYEKAEQGLRQTIGTKNLHTLYFEQLLSGGQKVIDIGKGEIFYRKKDTFYKPARHKKNTFVVGKTYKEDGILKTVPSEEYKQLCKYFLKELQENELTDEAKKLKDKVTKNKFDYDIVKNKRFIEDTYLFHLSIIINFKADIINFKESGAPKFNDTVNTYLKNNPDIHILSIDRGERHLAYYTLLNQRGEIKEQGSLNTITYQVKGEKEERRVDYHQKLHDREMSRGEARKSWNTIETIKELKEGYLSRIVHTIATMMVQHNAIVVFEDLNSGFKRGRFKFEKQVYQKLEKMLIDKLNYLVFKDKTAGEIGGTLCGYQLTAPFVSFQKLGKQTGFIFYVPAYHTSKICPATGFVNLLYPKYQNVPQAKKFFEKFNSIRYNKQEDYFEFKVYYKNFNDKVSEEAGKKEWTICTNGTRLKNKNEKNQWKTEEVNLTEGIKSLLDANNIEYEHGEDLCKHIAAQNDSKFFKSLFYYLSLTLQLRNSRRDTEDETDNKNDYILSCVKDEHGHFFDSRTCDSTMPVNSDANGAYHIGLKGLWALQKINEWDTSNLNLTISNEQWYDFVQNKQYNTS